MNDIRLFIILLLAGIVLSCSMESNPPLSLHPENPHYFLFRGKPAILIGSTESYMAVVSKDFNYIAYLNEIASSGLNVTRTFSGVLVGPSGLNPKIGTFTIAPERYLCPWSRSSVPGYPNGGNKFDLTKWDEAYFSRLKDFVTEAGKRNIVVELDLFSNYYDTVHWKLSPLYFANNININDKTKKYKEILSLSHPEILEVQEKMVRKIISELKNFDNLYYEICNEPYYNYKKPPVDWEKYMTAVVVDAEKDFVHKHLISNNIANNFLKLENSRENVSIYNFHYARPPVAVTMNYQLNKVIGDNETGFDGREDEPYRNEAWNFILAGGGIFNHLDYSFTAGNEDGTFIITKGIPGGGGKSLRHQFRILVDFMKGIDYINMVPDTSFIRILKPENSTVHALVGKDETYAAYINNSADQKDMTISEIEVDLPVGSYEVIWLNTKTEAKEISKLDKHPGGKLRLVSPEYSRDIALKITALK
ncbi:MAG: glycoside hydrolase family 5 protein [Prolixibacteraceae bacterium]|jgi:hypothetical protein|nr:glycoside hydrolase family 5 protein [Prolixibacteraceae bacterium]